MLILYINTEDQKKAAVSLKKGGKVIASLSEENDYGSQALLPLIKKLLESQKVKFKDLAGIEVETGPGSFTGLRVGVSVANALGFALGIAVNGKKFETQLIY